MLPVAFEMSVISREALDQKGVPTIFIKESFRLAAPLQKAFRRRSQTYYHPLDRKTLVGGAEEVLIEHELPDLDAVSTQDQMNVLKKQTLTSTPIFQISTLWSHSAPRMTSGARYGSDWASPSQV